MSALLACRRSGFRPDCLVPVVCRCTWVSLPGGPQRLKWSSSDKNEFYRNPRKIHHTYNKLQFGPLLVSRQAGDTTDQSNAESKASDFEAQTSKTLSRSSYPAGGDPPRTVIRIPFSLAGDRAASPSVNKVSQTSNPLSKNQVQGSDKI